MVRMLSWIKSEGGINGIMMTMFAEAKYMVEDALSKKFLIGNFTNYKMTDSRPVIIDKLPHSIKDFRHTLKHKEELTLIELDSHLCIEESLRAQDSDKPNDNNVVGP
ncbi:hypothetical protein Tco_1462016 [Tanacetum coccineum]